jgi:hypothetical protein
MAKFTIAHISDLHFSSGIAGDNPHSHSIAHLKKIESILSGQKLDKLIVSGDLTDAGDIESLLLVKDWLFGEISISGKEKIGLRLSPEIVGIVPGNHDAYNTTRQPGSSLACWQRSIENYKNAFPKNCICGCNYEWLEKEGYGLYVAYADTSFLGDPMLRRLKKFKQLAIEGLSKPARGKLSLQQSEQLLNWFDLGMTGDLNASETYKIPKEKFAQSFKLLVMHHYLFEPEGFKDDFFLQLHHRDTVFRNIALADFDMNLCGHKHVSDFKTHYYGEHFDRRSKWRYMLNLFRRRLGANTLPFQFKDKNGLTMPHWINRLLEVCAVIVNTAHEEKDHIDEDRFIESVLELLNACMKNPAKFGGDLEVFFKTHRISGLDKIDNSCIREIQTRLCSGLSKKQKDILAQTGLTYIKKIAKGMHSRPFIQSMCGSSAKASRYKVPRSLNIYDFEFTEESYRVKRTRYDLNDEATSVPVTSDTEFHFSNHHHVTLRGSSN